LTNTLQKYIQIDDKNNKNKYNENYNNYLHPTKKPAEFSDLFKNIIGSSKNVLDPCCGTGALICTFENNSLGLILKSGNQ
jgi:tRNA G10  N-methylase Trm11